jgi:ribosomal protein S18
MEYPARLLAQPVILATWVAESGKIVAQGQTGK